MDEVVVIEGAVEPEGAEYLRLPFEVPAGIVELQISHRSTGADDILDFGLESPVGQRGWGGGNPEDAVVGEAAASRSYLPGPITPGTWQVLLGKAQLVGPEPGYRVEVTLRTTASLAAQPERRDYAPVDLGGGPRWVAGDLHVHSRESGDASPSLAEVAAFARGRGLDFVVLTEHNTASAASWIGATQDTEPDLLLVPGIELTTYGGHANAFGLAEPVPFALGLQVDSFADVALAVADAGALLSLNHPKLDLGDLCIGCAWEHDVPASLAGLEVGTGAWSKAGQLFTPATLELWEELCEQGNCPAALGGSDDHRAGAGTGALDSAIGSPTTLVWVETLSVAALLDGIRAGHTVVKLEGPDDPMVELSGVGSTVSVRVSGGEGAQLRLIEDGELAASFAVDSADWEYEGPVTGTRVRAELWVDGAPRTLTSHVFAGEGEAPADAPPCGCASPGGSAGAGGLAVGLAVMGMRRGRGRARHIRPAAGATATAGLAADASVASGAQAP
jgi:hypothetical protein